jgi:epidermal growth factor receptor substrate 15
MNWTVCREKLKLEQEKTQKEADIKIRNGEVMSLQKELDALTNTVKQLEAQKAEAQKRLDELDDKVLSAVFMLFVIH